MGYKYIEYMGMTIRVGCGEAPMLSHDNCVTWEHLTEMEHQELSPLLESTRRD